MFLIVADQPCVQLSLFFGVAVRTADPTEWSSANGSDRQSCLAIRGLWRFALQILVDRASGFFAVAHGQDHGRGGFDNTHSDE